MEGQGFGQQEGFNAASIAYVLRSLAAHVCIFGLYGSTVSIIEKLDGVCYHMLCTASLTLYVYLCSSSASSFPNTILIARYIYMTTEVAFILYDSRVPSILASMSDGSDFSERRTADTTAFHSL